MVLSRFAFLTPWFCSHAPTIALGQALTHILQFSGVLATEDQKVCYLLCTIVAPVHYQHVFFRVDSKIATLTLGEAGGRAVHTIRDP